MLEFPFSQIIPPSPSPSESKSLVYTSVSFFLSCIRGQAKLGKPEELLQVRGWEHCRPLFPFLLTCPIFKPCLSCGLQSIPLLLSLTRATQEIHCLCIYWKDEESINLSLIAVISALHKLRSLSSLNFRGLRTYWSSLFVSQAIHVRLWNNTAPLSPAGSLISF